MVAVVHRHHVARRYSAPYLQLHDRNYFSWFGHGDVWPRTRAAVRLHERGGGECGKFYNLSTPLSRARRVRDGDGGPGYVGGAFLVAVARAPSGGPGGFAQRAGRHSPVGAGGIRSRVGRGRPREWFCRGRHFWRAAAESLGAERSGEHYRRAGLWRARRSLLVAGASG